MPKQKDIFIPLKGQRAFEEVSTQIKKLVFEGILKPGDRLPSETDIKALRENILRAKADVKKNKMATDANFDFHKLLAKAAKNNVLVILMELILVALSHLLSRRPPNFKTTRSAIEYHEEILEAIVSKDRVTAMGLLEDHLKEVERQLKALPYDPEFSVAI